VMLIYLKFTSVNTVVMATALATTNLNVFGASAIHAVTPTMPLKSSLLLIPRHQFSMVNQRIFPSNAMLFIYQEPHLLMTTAITRLKLLQMTTRRKVNAHKTTPSTATLLLKMNVETLPTSNTLSLYLITLLQLLLGTQL